MWQINYIYVYIFRGIRSFLSFLLQFKQIKSSGIEDGFMKAANLLLYRSNIIQLPLRLVITKCTYEKHIEGDGGFWDLRQISDYKLKRFWDLSLYRYMKILSFLLHLNQIKSSGIEDGFMNPANLHLYRINIIQLALWRVIT